MKNSYKTKISLVLLCAIASLYSCGKSSDSATKPTTPVVAKTYGQLLVSAPWKITAVSFYDDVTREPWLVTGIPDSLANLTFTFNTDSTYTETGAKTATGTWSLFPHNEAYIALTSGTPAATVVWNFAISSKTFIIANKANVTFQNPSYLLDGYFNETLAFGH